jgi:hypothetical protein
VSVPLSHQGRVVTGISAEELDRRLAFARKYPAHAHTLPMGLLLFPGQGPPPACSICGGTDAPIVDGMHLEGFCGCHGVWTDDEFTWQAREDLWAPLIGPPMETWEPEQQLVTETPPPLPRPAWIREPIQINGVWGVRIGPPLEPCGDPS